MKDKKIFKFMRKVSVVSVLAAGLAAPSVTQAANHDLHDGKGNAYTKVDILFNPALIDDFLFNLPSYQYELNGKLYDFTKINELVNAGATEETLAQKIEEAGLKGTAISETATLTGELDPRFQPGGELAALGVQRLVVDVSAIGKGITTADVTAVTINANAAQGYNIQSSGLIIVDKNLTKQSVVKVTISGVEYTVTVN